MGPETYTIPEQYETVPIPSIHKDKWPDLDLHRLGAVCYANKGRSVIWETVMMQAITQGAFPPIDVFSAGLYPEGHTLSKNLPDRRVLAELNKQHYNTLGLRSKLLEDCLVDDRTDVLFLGEGTLIDELPYKLTATPRSVICFPLRDPSLPQEGLTVELGIKETIKQLEWLVCKKLLGILYNVVQGYYPDNIIRGLHHPGVIYPYSIHVPRPRAYLLERELC